MGTFRSQGNLAATDKRPKTAERQERRIIEAQASRWHDTPNFRYNRRGSRLAEEAVEIIGIRVKKPRERLTEGHIAPPVVPTIFELFYIAKINKPN